MDTVVPPGQGPKRDEQRGELESPKEIQRQKIGPIDAAKRLRETLNTNNTVIFSGIADAFSRGWSSSIENMPIEEGGKTITLAEYVIDTLNTGLSGTEEMRRISASALLSISEKTQNADLRTSIERLRPKVDAALRTTPKIVEAEIPAQLNDALSKSDYAAFTRIISGVIPRWNEIEMITVKRPDGRVSVLGEDIAFVLGTALALGIGTREIRTDIARALLAIHKRTNSGVTKKRIDAQSMPIITSLLPREELPIEGKEAPVKQEPEMPRRPGTVDVAGEKGKPSAQILKEALEEMDRGHKEGRDKKRK